MSELQDQILSGGPGQTDLTAEQQQLADDLAARPEKWAFELGREEFRSALAEAVMSANVGTGHPPHSAHMATAPLEEYAVAVATCDGSEFWARQILAYLGHGPAMFFGPPEFPWAFRRAVRALAQWQRSLPPEYTWWHNNPVQIMDGLMTD